MLRRRLRNGLLVGRKRHGQGRHLDWNQPIQFNPMQPNATQCNAMQANQTNKVKQQQQKNKNKKKRGGGAKDEMKKERRVMRFKQPEETKPSQTKPNKHSSPQGVL